MKPTFGDIEQIKSNVAYQAEQEAKEKLDTYEVTISFSGEYYVTVQAETEETMIIALKTDDFELMKTDISTLAIGESQTIETEGGKVIDILRTADGAEIYVDGELLEMDIDHEGLHQEHSMTRHIEIICNDDEERDENVIVKVFRASTGLTVAEIKAGIKVPEFKDKWEDKWAGKIKVKAKGTGAAEGAPQAAQATGAAAKTEALFGDD